jgi:hypothetical protein
MDFLMIYIISFRGDAYRTSLTLPLFIEVPVPSQKSEWSHICVLGVSILRLFPQLFILSERKGFQRQRV